jgi:hypothetical protein
MADLESETLLFKPFRLEYEGQWASRDCHYSMTNKMQLAKDMTQNSLQDRRSTRRLIIQVMYEGAKWNDHQEYYIPSYRNLRKQLCSPPLLAFIVCGLNNNRPFLVVLIPQFQNVDQLTALRVVIWLHDHGYPKIQSFLQLSTLGNHCLLAASALVLSITAFRDFDRIRKSKLADILSFDKKLASCSTEGGRYYLHVSSSQKALRWPRRSRFLSRRSLSGNIRIWKL